MIEFRFFLFLFKRRLSLNFVDVLSTTTRDWPSTDLQYDIHTTCWLVWHAIVSILRFVHCPSKISCTGIDIPWQWEPFIKNMQDGPQRSTDYGYGRRCYLSKASNSTNGILWRPVSGTLCAFLLFGNHETTTNSTHHQTRNACSRLLYGSSYIWISQLSTCS